MLARTFTAKQVALQETVDLRLWIVRCRNAGIPIVPALVCPITVPIYSILNGCISPKIPALGDWTERTTRQVAARDGKAMWRWSHCAPIEIKAVLAKPGIPIRMPWPKEALDDERLLAILSDCRADSSATVTTIVRPWVAATIEADYPVEFRVFVTASGQTSTSSYYSQRALNNKWMPFAEEATRMAKLLRTYVATGIDFSADFLVTASKEVIFLEGGPSYRYGADPCCLNPSHSFGDNHIAFKKER